MTYTVDDLIPIVPDYLESNNEEESEQLNTENNNESEEEETGNNTTTQTDYSSLLSDIIANQEIIISNQETIIFDNQSFENHYQLQDNAFRAMTNILVISLIVICGVWVCKNIFIKMM